MCDCDYCNVEQTILEDYKSSDGTIRSLDIIFIPKLRHIRVKTVDSNELEVNFGIDKRINFCPMCGRRL